jgi:hypothetical protein
MLETSSMHNAHMCVARKSVPFFFFLCSSLLRTRTRKRERFNSVSKNKKKERTRSPFFIFAAGCRMNFANRTNCQLPWHIVSRSSLGQHPSYTIFTICPLFSIPLLKRPCSLEPSPRPKAKPSRAEKKVCHIK